MERPARPGDACPEQAWSEPTPNLTPTAGVRDAPVCATEGGAPLSRDVRQADRELLAMLIGTGTTARSTSRTGVVVNRLLARFGSVAGLIQAHPADLAIVDGIGQVAAARISAAFELTRRAATEAAPERITSQADLVEVVAPLLRGRARERAVVVSCGRAHRVLGCDIISEGSADRALMPPREAVVSVLRRDGSAFAMAHNHPSGDPTPSADDLQATARMAQAARAVGFQFLGHVVVADMEWRYMPDYGGGLPRSAAG